MSEELAKQLDFDLAWKRAKADLPHRLFVRHPFEIDLIESDVTKWLADLKSEFETGRYHPSPMLVCDVPKPNGAIRPGAHLATNDRILFAACVGACLPYIHTTLSWSQGIVDFSYLLSKRIDDVSWMKSQFTGWKEFERKTLQAITGDVSHVLFTDITGYYENIVLETLMSDLRQTGAPDDVVVQISSMLNRWVVSPGRGLPQGHAPSDILAKVYLNSVDESLRNQNIEHLRYVDDFRILARSESEAKQILMELTKLLRHRGLSLQTAKTKILPVDQACERIEGLTRVLLDVRYRFLAEAREFYDATGYMPLDEAEELLEQNTTDDPNETPVHIIREAFNENFINADDTGFPVKGLVTKFDKTLFHFLLNRLGKVKDNYAVEYCLSLLAERPEETEHILKYLKRNDSISSCDDAIAGFLESENAIYSYQIYQIIEWRMEDEAGCSSQVTAVVRALSFDATQPTYLRSVARALLARTGNHDEDTRHTAFDRVLPVSVQSLFFRSPAPGVGLRVRAGPGSARAAGNFSCPVQNVSSMP
ncbi:MAG: reverse transcriptase domain-containing protein, partial [Fuerstiella sp.]